MNKTQLNNYEETKQILLGNQSIRPEFKPFVEWFEKTYDVEIANIVYKMVMFPNHRAQKPIPHLDVIFKFSKDFNKFYDENQSISDIETKQLVDKKFKESLAEQGLSQEDVLNEPNNSTEGANKTEDFVSVIFECFEYKEKEQVRRNIPKAKIDALLEKINNKDIWQIWNYYSGATILVYTEQQVEKYRDSAAFAQWKDLFFELIQVHNELVFFKRESLVISLNSKERVDEASNSELSGYR